MFRMVAAPLRWMFKLGFIVGTFLLGAQAMAADRLITIQSEFTTRETADRLEAAAKEKGMMLFSRIDHAAGAAAVGMPLRPMELLIFGNAKAGTPLMQVEPTVGIDLPLKALVYEDAAGKVWLSYNEPRWVAQRHGLQGRVGPVLDAMTAALSAVASSATGKTSAAKERE
jgi:uncharacterized protein (DUF302 family)